MLQKTYQPADIEKRIYQEWEQAGVFRCGRPERVNAEPYCIVIPPPNVTGSLHMGHALNNTLQDILCRFERMRGKDRKSTRLNSSHVKISYAVFCLKKKNNNKY